MVLDKNGNPLTAVADRAKEVARCMEVIGWSWQRLADRLEVRLATAMRIKTCKVPVQDSDLRWLQSLADAVGNLPRPAPQDDPLPLATAEIGQDRVDNRAPQMPQMPEVDVDVVAQVRAEIAEQSATALTAAITSLYAQSQPMPGGMSDEQSRGARWALGELAQQLGVLDLVQSQLQHFQSQAQKAAAERTLARGVLSGGVSADTRQPIDA